MDILKKIFPGAFGVKDVVSMIIRIVIYVVVGAIAGVLIGVLAKIMPELTQGKGIAQRADFHKYDMLLQKSP